MSIVSTFEKILVISLILVISCCGLSLSPALRGRAEAGGLVKREERERVKE
jgi:hypothetical protein